jgi:LAO/AO transport system kinase
LTSKPVTAGLFSRIRSGDPRALARAATLVENQSAAGRHLLTELFPYTGGAIVVGITGPPGAGKSTLVDRLTKLLRKSNKTVGVIAVDPSSPYSKGAIMGDRIRMADHHQDSGVFIRSMATRGRLGGVAQSTLELALLLDAARYDVVLIETVGVGQDEIDIVRLADVTVVVLVPGLGDDVQAIKAGIMEVADLFAINKADQPGAERLEQEIRFMQSLAHPSEPSASVCRVAAATGEGVEDLLACIELCFKTPKSPERQTERWVLRLRDMLREHLMAAIPEDELVHCAGRVAQRLQDPYSAIAILQARMAGAP